MLGAGLKQRGKGTPFKKGVSANPYLEMTQIRHSSRVETNQLVRHIGSLSVKETYALNQAPDTPNITRAWIACYFKALDGDCRHLNIILERTDGKIAQVLDHQVTEKIDVLKLSAAQQAETLEKLG